MRDTKALEGNEDALRSDPANALGELANSTGGLSFNNTNNLRQGFDRVESDLRNYYLLGYTPVNEKYDGRFRNIQVKVKRPDVTIAFRKGYFAVRDPGGAPINPWEAAALGTLEEKPVPNAFPVRAGAMLFPERGRPGLVPVVVELKTAPLTFQPAADGKTYTSDVTVLVRFVDDQNRVVRKVSQHYEVTGAIGEIDGAKQGRDHLLQGIGAPRGGVHDGDRRTRRAGWEIERSLLHRRGGEVPRELTAHEQPRAGEAGREGSREGTPRRQSAPRE